MSSMNIILIDDELPLIRFFATYLGGKGHSLSTYDDPEKALRDLAPSVDLVITDVSMPKLDGFEVAREVADRLGTTPPRTLLISGYDQEERMRQVSPREVIGIMYKPFKLSGISEILRNVRKTRRRCPGKIQMVCDAITSPPVLEGADCDQALCRTPEYANCPVFAEKCGRKFQEWIQKKSQGRILV